MTGQEQPAHARKFSQQVEIGRALYSAPKEYLGQHLDAPSGLGAGQAASPGAAGEGPSPAGTRPPGHRPR
jgi:hypothetical protein